MWVAGPLGDELFTSRRIEHMHPFVLQMFLDEKGNRKSV